MQKSTATAIATTVLYTLLNAYQVSWAQDSSRVKEMTIQEIEKYLPKQDEDLCEDLISTYEDPNLRLEWTFNTKLPVEFIDDIFKDGLEDATKFFNAFFIKDRYHLIPQENEFDLTSYIVRTYDINLKTDNVEGHKDIDATKFMFDINRNPRTIMSSAEGGLVGSIISGDGFGTLRYEKNNEGTKITIDFWADINWVGDALASILNPFNPEYIPEEDLSEKRDSIQKDFTHATNVLKSDSSYILMDRAVDLGKISKKDGMRYKEKLRKLHQNYVKQPAYRRRANMQR